MTARRLLPKRNLIAFCALRCSAGFFGGAARLVAVMLVLSGVSALPLQAGEDDRVALILAVEAYKNYGKSNISTNTVKAIGTALKDQGFTVDVVTDANNAVARATLREFAHKAEGARVAIVVLAGHGVGSGGHAYLLPSNAEIRRASDLLSRGIAVSSVAQIAGRAKHGAVFFFMTVADIPSTLQSISARPSITTTPSDNVVIVFSTSDKVPVSRVGAVSQQAALDFSEAAAEKPLMMSTLVGSASAGDIGKVLGEVADIDLSKAPERASPAATSASSTSQEEIEARREAELRAREAERRARDAEARAREAEARAKLEAQRARDAQAAVESAPAPHETSATTAATSEASDTESLKVVEALLGRSKKKELQKQLQSLGYYKGPIDAIFGVLTRQAIRDYQARLGDEVTGYLTPKQIQSLVEG
jgi:Putative peptidoglycan binding domain/Caspase domain